MPQPLGAGVDVPSTGDPVWVTVLVTVTMTVDGETGQSVAGAEPVLQSPVEPGMVMVVPLPAQG